MKLIKTSLKISQAYAWSALITLLILSSCSGKSDVELRRYPYLQSAMGDTLTVLWRTNKGAASSISLRPSDGEQWKTIQGETRTTNTGLIENEVILKGLLPNTKYEYKIHTDGDLLSSEIYSFNSPKISSDNSFTFFAVGDIGEPVEDQGQPDILGNALAKSVGKYDLGILLGDIVYPEGESEMYDENLFQHFTGVFPYVPVYTVLGNHDWHEPADNYMQEWKLPNNEHYYSFDYGQVHFIGLDSKNGEFHQFEEQKKWLENDLSKVPQSTQWIVVFLHHNGKSCTYKDDYPNVVELYPIFEAYGVDLVLNGHAHTYERLNPMKGNGEILQEFSGKSELKNLPGFLSITIGSGGKLRGVGSDPTPFEPSAEDCRHAGLLAKAVHDWAYLELSVDGKSIKGRAIATNTLEVVDSFELSKN